MSDHDKDTAEAPEKLPRWMRPETPEQKEARYERITREYIAKKRRLYGPYWTL